MKTELVRIEFAGYWLVFNCNSEPFPVCLYALFPHDLLNGVGYGEIRFSIVFISNIIHSINIRICYSTGTLAPFQGPTDEQTGRQEDRSAEADHVDVDHDDPEEEETLEELDEVGPFY